MADIERIIDRHADIKVIAQETQLIWLAEEALAFALEMPFSKIVASIPHH